MTFTKQHPKSTVSCKIFNVKRMTALVSADDEQNSVKKDVSIDTFAVNEIKSFVCGFA